MSMKKSIRDQKAALLSILKSDGCDVEITHIGDFTEAVWPSDKEVVLSIEMENCVSVIKAHKEQKAVDISINTTVGNDLFALKEVCAQLSSRLGMDRKKKKKNLTLPLQEGPIETGTSYKPYQGKFFPEASPGGTRLGDIPALQNLKKEMVS